MDDAGLLEQINALVHEEHTLREQVQAGTIAGDEEHARLRDIEVRREFGEDPSGAQVRSAGEVEGYRQ